MTAKIAILSWMALLAFGCSSDGKKTCTGWASPCEMFTSSEACLEQIGCDTSGRCTGNATNCLAVTNADVCINQLGCSGWTGDCQGGVQVCSAYGSSETCEGQDGCDWDDSTGTCGGSPTWCVALLGDKEDCENQDYCLFLGGCTGVETECQDLHDASFCDRQDGCTWESEQCGGAAVPCELLTPEECERQFACHLE